uniref:Retrovirus-related Pol polyprotein from transposon TNT 1-94 n=1 Tax=Cajanus cajan TaxID=3821 RepID=A0A151REB2_CAJCA|nr:Retrovirus-related Pol polyprotein from transposon TNT 1-94 [Cajanus cajan]
MADSERDNYVQPAIPRFDGHYDHWAMLMENLLRSKNYWDVVENGIPALASTATQEQKKIYDETKIRDLKAKNYLFQAIERSIIETILCVDTSKDIWDSLKQKYQGSTKVKRAQLQSLRGEFEAIKMKTEENVNEYFARILSIVNKMKFHGEKVTQTTVVEKIMRSMSTKFNYVICSIEQANDIEELTIDGLQSSLLVEESRMKIQCDDEQALKVTGGTFKGRGRGRFGGRGRGRQASREHIECYKCHKFGHYQYECPNLATDVVNYTGFDEEEEMLLMALEGSKENDQECWFLDSGCSTHMCGVKRWFIDLDEQFREVVKLGDGRTLSVMGRGNVKLCVEGRIQIITGVYYIPNLMNNLLSIGQLQQKKLKIIFDDDKCRVYHKEKGLLMTSYMANNRMFPIKAKPVITEAACIQTSNVDSTEMWHKRYGHLSYGGLKLLNQKAMVKGLPELKEMDKVCPECAVGKQHRDAISKQSTWRATRRLELIHSDICGPSTPTSNSNRRYFITFIDDFSRKTWVFFLCEKAEAFETFKRFRLMVEKESNCVISCLRTDRGGEFNSNDFNEFCTMNGIIIYIIIHILF